MSVVDQGVLRIVTNAIVDSLYNNLPPDLSEISSHSNLLEVASKVHSEVVLMNLTSSTPVKHHLKKRKAQNFVNGTTYMDDFQTVLNQLELSDAAENTFLDLGCGDGECLLAASSLLSSSSKCVFSTVVGIELNHSKVLEAVVLSQLTRSLYPMLPSIMIEEGDFLDSPWWHTLSISNGVDEVAPNALVVYVCATCYTEDVRQSILHQVSALGKSRASSPLYLIQLDRAISPEDCELNNLTLSFVYPGLRTSWGEGTAYTYMYHREKG